jgi:hypothetical protein
VGQIGLSSDWDSELVRESECDYELSGSARDGCHRSHLSSTAPTTSTPGNQPEDSGQAEGRQDEKGIHVGRCAGQRYCRGMRRGVPALCRSSCAGAPDGRTGRAPGLFWAMPSTENSSAIEPRPATERRSTMSERVTTPFGATSTADDIIAGVDLAGRRAIVTGASSGIGLPTARALASAGADVTLAVRNGDAGQRAAAAIDDAVGAARTRVAELDLADQGSVAAFVRAWTGPLDVLVANAGVMATPELRTAEGWELQFATNHLGHFALTVGLHDALASGASRGEQHARVVVVSSVGARQRRRPLRRPRLSGPPVRPVGGVQPVQDGERPVRRRGCATLGR